MSENERTKNYFAHDLLKEKGDACLMREQLSIGRFVSRVKYY